MNEAVCILSNWLSKAAARKNVIFFKIDWILNCSDGILFAMNLASQPQISSSPAEDIDSVQQLISNNPTWNRRRISRELAELWNWRTPNGGLRDMACRSYLLKLHRQKLITLPSPQRPSNNDHRQWKIDHVPHTKDPIHAPLTDLQPIHIIPVRENLLQRNLVKCLIDQYHYLGYRGSPGKTLAYLVYDQHQRLLACLLFGAAAWSLRARDQFLGWNSDTRKKRLSLIANNQRFLILPWVQSYNLASHILAQIAKRIDDDYQHYFQQPIYLLETIVHTQKFRGTCYRAANWIRIGQTTGRTRNDRYTTIQEPSKDIYIYPLKTDFRQRLANNFPPQSAISDSEHYGHR